MSSVLRVVRLKVTRVARGEKSGRRRSRRSGARMRSRTRTALSFRAGGRPDGPTKPPRKTRCTGRGGTTRTQQARWELPPGTERRIPEKRRARWSLLRGPLGADEAGNIYTMSRPPVGRLWLASFRYPSVRVPELENIFTGQRVRTPRIAAGRI